MVLQARLHDHTSGIPILRLKSTYLITYLAPVAAGLKRGESIQRPDFPLLHMTILGDLCKDDNYPLPL